MGRVAVDTPDIAAGVGGLGEMRLFVSFAVAAQTARARLLPRLALENEYLGFITATGYVVRPRDRGNLRNLGGMDRLWCRGSSSSAAFSPSCYRFPRDRSCRFLHLRYLDTSGEGALTTDEPADCVPLAGTGGPAWPEE
jgi:hypothetical protein